MVSCWEMKVGTGMDHVFDSPKLGDPRTIYLPATFLSTSWQGHRELKGNIQALTL